MKCIDCLRLDVLQYLAHSKVGMGKCPDDAPGVFKTMRHERQCSKFVLMTEDQKKERHDAWLLKKNPPIRAKKETQDDQD